MPDEAGTVDNDAQEAPEQSGPPAEAPADESIDSQPADDPFEKRYNDLRPQYDRTVGELKQYQEFLSSLQDPETQAQALQALGLELEADEILEQDDDQDPTESKLAQIEQYLQSEADAKAEQELIALEKEFVKDEISRVEKASGDKFSDSYKQLLESVAWAHPDEDGLPDFEAAQKALQAEFEANRKSYLDSKRAEKVELGTAGSEDIDLSDPDARVKHTAAIVEAAMQRDTAGGSA